MIGLLALIENVTPSLVMYGFGLLFGVLSVLYFAKDILLSLSITSKSYALFVLSLSLFAVFPLFTSTILNFITISISAVSYSVSVFYIWKNFDIERIFRFGILISSSVLLVLVARGIQSNWFTENKMILLGVATLSFLLFLLVSLFDVRESEPISYSISTENSASTQKDSRIGDLDVENSGVFRRDFDIPNLNVVYSGEDQEFELPSKFKGTRDDLGSIGRKQSKNYGIEVRFGAFSDPRNDEVDLPEKVKIKLDQESQDVKKSDSIRIVLEESS